MLLLDKMQLTKNDYNGKVFKKSREGSERSN